MQHAFNMAGKKNVSVTEGGISCNFFSLAATTRISLSRDFVFPGKKEREGEGGSRGSSSSFLHSREEGRMES